MRHFRPLFFKLGHSGRDTANPVYRAASCKINAGVDGESIGRDGGGTAQRAARNDCQADPDDPKRFCDLVCRVWVKSISLARLPLECVSVTQSVREWSEIVERQAGCDGLDGIV